MTDQSRRNIDSHIGHLNAESLDPGDSALVASWDANVDFRADELANNGDVAYAALTTLVLGLLSESIAPGGSVLDAGCGLGYLANSMAAAGYHVEGIDPSLRSVEYARKKFNTLGFYAQTIESYAVNGPRAGRYDAVVANMVMHTTPQIGSFVASAAEVLRPGGELIATIPHPCFFLPTKESAPVPFEYSENRGFLLPFRIRGGRTHPEPVPYFQRTLEDYNEALHQAGLADLRIREPQRIGGSRYHDMLVLSAMRH
jgi:SAM-dependent methyltransferase